MAIFNELGEIVNDTVIATARYFSQTTDSLYEVLFEEGMTQVEAHALTDFLCGQICTGATMQMLKNRLLSRSLLGSCRKLVDVSS